MILGDVRFDLRHILWYSAIAGESVLLLRLLFLRLGREYRFFCAYLLVSVLRSIALLVAARSGLAFATNAYWLTWATTEPVLIGALIAFTLESYGLVHRYYPGVDDKGRPIIHRISIATGLVCLLSLIPDLRASTWQPSLALFFVVERTVTTLAAMLMALVVAAYAFMPVLMPPNIMRHARLVLAYLATNAIGYFGLNVWGSAKVWTPLLMGGCVLCFFLWTVLITRKGQIEPEPDPSCYDPDLERQWEELKAVSRAAPRIFRFRSKD